MAVPDSNERMSDRAGTPRATTTAVRAWRAPDARAAVQRYFRAFEAADVPGLVRLLADDAVLEMPPVPLWYLGSRDYGLFMRRVFDMRGTGWSVRQLSANGQPAFAAYA